MSDTKNVRSMTLSRRALLSACGAAPALLAASAFASPPKVSHACVGFLDAPRGDHKLRQLPVVPGAVVAPRRQAARICEHCSCRIWLPNLA